ncbi:MULTISPECIES: hypothetical protein [Bradyrhizobium]|uniref:Uncharacterized protein n=1 Tax=Bradyrhizobium septentrionale TaxID=1404411 RepID=A0A973ZZN2_9BRAD|nr:MULTISPECIES: hypothetical protein [Bradyrhizobium]MCK7672780.1 hypothetical protein [Bradyrhizobium sp. 2S1]QIG97778.1 hypothetical protein G6P99_39285 [Bradyrhizobium sp. 6(2017)]UGY20238.1 hypothetical protein HAP48_0024085 [Bradyrhizobium septentrionale]UGY29081.1 hypothetical protein HU675_0021435 [Bradyrhizobium septentrionale]
MNIDPWDTESFMESYSILLQEQSKEVSAQANSQVHSPPHQASFERQLTELPLDYERCPAASYVRGRAELAASLAGANVESLRNEIERAEQRSAQWPSTAGPSARVDGDRVFDEVLTSSYLQLHRFQDEISHCKPRMDDDVNAMSHVRSLADLRSRGIRHVSEAFCTDDLDEIDRARSAALHTNGYTEQSSFVSLAQDPSRLLLSEDTDSARAIAESARELHTYRVPRVAAWPADRIDGILARSRDPVDHDLRRWVSGTPTEETEVLFLGGDLEKYRTASQPNPYRTDHPGGNQEG